MTPDGAFIEPPKPSFLTILIRLAMFAIFLGMIWVAFWTALFLLPVILVLGVAGFFIARHRLKRFYVNTGVRPVFRR